ncbi:hypothetical protein CUMW_062370, partial [Citrus unshiu]
FFVASRSFSVHLPTLNSSDSSFVEDLRRIQVRLLSD